MMDVVVIYFLASIYFHIFLSLTSFLIVSLYELSLPFISLKILLSTTANSPIEKFYDVVRAEFIYPKALCETMPPHWTYNVADQGA